MGRLNLSSEEINLFFPVCGIISYPGGVIIRRLAREESLARSHIIKRGQITVVSKRSLNKLALLVRSCGVKFTSVLTLTYGVNYPLSGRVAKKHLNAFLTAFRREFGHFEYFWVLEFQHRGAVHFHLATTLDPPDAVQRSRFADIWTRIAFPDWEYCALVEEKNGPFLGEVLNCRNQGYVVHSHAKAWERVRSADGMGRYLAKYANKLRQKQVPEWYGDVGRFWGASRGVKLPDGEYYHGSDSDVRGALELQGRRVGNWGVLPKIVLV